LRPAFIPKPRRPRPSVVVASSWGDGTRKGAHERMRRVDAILLNRDLLAPKLLFSAF